MRLLEVGADEVAEPAVEGAHVHGHLGIVAITIDHMKHIINSMIIIIIIIIIRSSSSNSSSSSSSSSA